MLGGLQLRALHHELVDSGKMTDRQFHDAVLRENAIPIAMIRASLTNQRLTRDFEPSWRFYDDVASGKPATRPAAMRTLRRPGGRRARRLPPLPRLQRPRRAALVRGRHPLLVSQRPAPRPARVRRRGPGQGDARAGVRSRPARAGAVEGNGQGDQPGPAAGRFDRVHRRGQVDPVERQRRAVVARRGELRRRRAGATTLIRPRKPTATA